MEITEVYPKDFERVYHLLQLFENTRFKKEDFKKLFQTYWQSSVNHKGLKVEENGEVVAYLGLVFSDRVINGQAQVFCNLTTLIIHPSQRGKKLTHKIVGHLVQQGNYTFTAITPIPGLYNMYRQNGFTDLDDRRLILWSRFSNKKDHAQYSENPEELTQRLKGEEARIYADHKQFNAIHAVYTVDNTAVYMVFKERVNQLRKFFDKRFTNYADTVLRKLGFKGFLYKPTTTYELLYTSHPQLFATHVKPIMASLFNLHPVAGVAVPLWLQQKFNLQYPFANTFVHSRQMYLSKTVQPEGVDTLYSEIFVLDM